MSIIAKKLLNKPSRVIWCGDYAEDEELQVLSKDLTVEGIYGNPKAKGVTSKKVDRDILKGKYLVNHDKKIYIDLDKYCLIADEFNREDDKGWIINPISLLTAVGNNRGGGDYYEGDRTTCFDKVGTWAYDLISLETKAPTDYIEETHIVFTEQVNDENRHLVNIYGLTQSFVKSCI